MPFRDWSGKVGERDEFVRRAALEGANVRALCREYGISAPTGYKWLARYRLGGAEGLEDRSRRPLSSPWRTPPAVEAAVLRVRDAHPAWGARKILAYLWAPGRGRAPTGRRPAASTATEILRRHGLLDPAEAPKHRAWRRFEHERPNALWQMDFKGHFALIGAGGPGGEAGAAGDGGVRCHPLTVLDDHSRFSLALEACADEREGTVRARLAAVFRRCGLPERILADNGSPWGTAGAAGGPHTALTVWLLRLGVAVAHGRPYHPQTQGKDERFHRTLQAELLRGRAFADLAACQRAFDAWRAEYNAERPHQALGMATPASRYAPSPRPFPEALPPIEYPAGAAVRRVQGGGEVHFRGRVLPLGAAFRGQPVALLPQEGPGAQDGRFDVLFCAHRVATADLRLPDGHPRCVTHLPERA